MVQSAAEAPAPPRRWSMMSLAACGMWLSLFCLIALALGIRNGTNWFFDSPLLWEMHAAATPLRDHVFLFFSYIGYRYGVVPIDIILVLVLLMLRYRREAVFGAVALIGSAIFNYGCKQCFQRPRPALWGSIAPEVSHSFPSGHAMASMALAMTVVLLSWHTRWRWRVLAIMPVFVIGVGVSRLYLGVHYPSDVLAGWCVALVWVMGSYLALFRQRRPWQT